MFVQNVHVHVHVLLCSVLHMDWSGQVKVYNVDAALEI